MKIKQLFAMAVVAVVAFSACNKEDGPKNSKPENDIFLQMTQPGAVDAKSISGSVTAGTVTEFDEGGLFFTDNAGNILLYKRITADGSTGTFTVNQLENGVLIENVSKQATLLQIVGGYDFGSDNFATMDQVSAIITNIEEQTDNNFGVQDATLFGSGRIVDFVGTPKWNAYKTAEQAAGRTPDDPDMQVQVELKALMARFEISDLTADNSDVQVNKITSFELSGIYIDNFYYEIGITGRTNPALDLYYFSALLDKTMFASWTNSGKYFDGSQPTPANPDWNWENYVYNNDDNNTPIGTISTVTNGLKFAPASPNVWAYNFFPVANITPHIVFHLTGVKYIEKDDVGVTDTELDFNTNGVAYLTAYQYINDDVNQGTVSFEGGWIYRLKDVLFNYDDLGEEPGPDPDNEFTVWVEIEVMPWKDKNIKVIW